MKIKKLKKNTPISVEYIMSQDKIDYRIFLLIRQICQEPCIKKIMIFCDLIIKRTLFIDKIIYVNGKRLLCDIEKEKLNLFCSYVNDALEENEGISNIQWHTDGEMQCFFEWIDELKDNEDPVSVRHELDNSISQLIDIHLF